MDNSTLVAPYADASYDVIVVGAGTTGLIAATLLAQDGISVAVVDPQRLVCHHPRGTHIDDEMMRILHMFGADDELHFLRQQGHQVQNSAGDAMIEYTMNGPRTDQGYWSDYQFHQPDFESRIRGRLADQESASLWLGWRAAELDLRDGGVELVVRDTRDGQEHRLTATYLIGADGAGSWTRTQLGTEVEDMHGTQTSLVVDIYPFEPSPILEYGVGFQRSSAGWPDTYVPIQWPMGRFERMLRPGDDPRVHERPENVYEFLRPWHKPGTYRIMRTDVYTWKSLLAKSWRTGNVFLAGDAAHTMPPFLGQGMCSGIRDAVNLAWKLSDVIAGRGAPDLLDTYESERLPQVRPYIEESARIANLIERTDATPEAVQQSVAHAIDEAAQVVGAPPSTEAPAEKQIHQNAQFRPALGPGLLDAAQAGTGVLAPLPRADSGAVFDDLVGYRFGVYLTAAVRGEVDAGIREQWDRIGAVAVEADSTEFESWAREHDCVALIVRPDRYIYSAAADAAELLAATRSLSERLMNGVSA